MTHDHSLFDDFVYGDKKEMVLTMTHYKVLNEVCTWWWPTSSPIPIDTTAVFRIRPKKSFADAAITKALRAA